MAKIVDEAWRIIVFLGIQYTLGRRGSFPYGILVKYSLLKISILVIISDLFQTVLLLNFFDYFFYRMKWIKRLKEKIGKKQKKPEKNRWQKFKKMGNWGLLLIATLPYGGGALTGSIFAVSVKMEKKKAFFLIICGCIINTCLYYLAFAGIISIFKKN